MKVRDLRIMSRPVYYITSTLTLRGAGKVGLSSTATNIGRFSPETSAFLSKPGTKQYGLRHFRRLHDLFHLSRTIGISKANILGERQRVEFVILGEHTLDLPKIRDAEIFDG
jgi:hypothetical protein